MYLLLKWGNACGQAAALGGGEGYDQRGQRVDWGTDYDTRHLLMRFNCCLR